MNYLLKKACSECNGALRFRIRRGQGNPVFIKLVLLKVNAIKYARLSIIHMNMRFARNREEMLNGFLWESFCKFEIIMIS